MSINKHYSDKEYDRVVVDKKEILELIREELGFTQGEASKLIYDGKIVPVVVLNPSSFGGIGDYDKWDYLGSFPLTHEGNVCVVNDLGYWFVQSLGSVYFSYGVWNSGVDATFEDYSMTYNNVEAQQLNRGGYVLVQNVNLFMVLKNNVVLKAWDITSDVSISGVYYLNGMAISNSGKYLIVCYLDLVGGVTYNKYIAFYEGGKIV